jgi:hypothetical protein
MENNLLFHKVRRFGQTLKLLVIPKPRREAIVRMAHADSHFSARRTKERIITSGLFWENMMRDCVQYTNECQQCQLRARKTVFDRVPTKPKVKMKFNYALIDVDSCSRYPFSYPLRSLGLKKSEFVKSKIKFLDHICGSGNRSVDPEKVLAVKCLKEPETKRQLRQLIGFFSFFREYIPGFALICKPLTDLTGKRTPDRIPFGSREREALNSLKQMLCNAADRPLSIIDLTKQFSLFVDSSNFAVGAALTQPDAEGHERPIAFASSKLTETQQRWATIEKEAYAALWALQKYKYWLYGRSVILYSDHNPITFLIDSMPKSSKLMRWHLALQEFDVQFRFRKGSTNEAADCLSRMVNYEDGGFQPVAK